MLVLGINKICKWVQITTGERKYTCPTKDIGDLEKIPFSAGVYI